MTGRYVLEAKDISKEYKMGKELTVKALTGIDFRVEGGDFVALMGPSGSGKTTLLNILSGLDRPSEGAVSIGELDITKMDQSHLSKIRQEKIGFIFQVYNLIPVLSAIENVELPMVFAGVPQDERQRRAKELLEKVGLGKRTTHRPTELSGGEQQRVAIARALINNPKIIMADEPTGNLDTKTGLEIIELMKELQKESGVTIIVATHDPKVADVVDIITYLRDGQIIGEDVQKEGIETAKSVTLIPERDLTKEMIDEVMDKIKDYLFASKVQNGDKIKAYEMEFEVKNTDPQGRVRISKETEIEVKVR